MERDYGTQRSEERHQANGEAPFEKQGEERLL
jgi:hypothetical protein